MSAQSKFMSWVEAYANIAVGFGINLLANIWLLPLWGFHPTVGDALGIGLAFTAISLVRSYGLRRAFEWLRVNGKG